MNNTKNLLVVSGHAADFVWRSGGVIAKAVKNNVKVNLVVLSFGIRGESGSLWNDENQTVDNVRKIRKAEAEKAINILGVKNYEYWDYLDYPMSYDRDKLDKLAIKIREVRPDTIVTHWKDDAFNPDHITVADYVFKASVMATSKGVQLNGLPATKQSKIFGFEPHQPEISNFTPDTLIDITEVYEQKLEAMKCYQAQSHLIEYYDQKARMRGNQARRISGNQNYEFAETFMRFFPYVGKDFV